MAGGYPGRRRLANLFATGAVAAGVYVFNPLAGNAVALDHSDGTGTNARFFNPTGTAVDLAGNIYIADGGDHTVREVTSSGVVTTIAGSSGQPGSADGVGANARFLYPCAVAVDGAGTVYVTDLATRMCARSQQAGSSRRWPERWASQAAPTGSALAAQFNLPQGIAVDAAGNVYVSDTNNDTIRMISTGGVVTTLAGSVGQAGDAGGRAHRRCSTTPLAWPWMRWAIFMWRTMATA